jgi:hypothetical protein
MKEQGPQQDFLLEKLQNSTDWYWIMHSDLFWCLAEEVTILMFIAMLFLILNSSRSTTVLIGFG